MFFLVVLVLFLKSALLAHGKLIPQLYHFRTAPVANFTVSGLKISQGCALCVQYSRCARNHLGSSRLPALIDITSGRAEVDANSGEPQFSQKPRRAVLPVAAVSSWYRGSPRSSRKLAL